MTTTTIEEALEAPVADLQPLGLSVRQINMLERHMGIVYVGDLQGVTAEDLNKIKHWGPVDTSALRRALIEFLNRVGK